MSRDLSTIKVPENIKLLEVKDDGNVLYVDMLNINKGILTGKMEKATETVGKFSNEFINEKSGTWNSDTVSDVCEALISHQNKLINISRSYGTRLPNGKMIITISIQKIEEKFVSAEDLKKEVDASKKK